MSLLPHHTTDPVCALCELKLASAHPFLQNWFRATIKPVFKAAHVSWAYRDQASQELAFDEGKSRLHFPQSAHNKVPALALDLFELDDQGKAVWHPRFFSDVNALNVAKKLPITWGAYFKGLGDHDHYQLTEA